MSFWSDITTLFTHFNQGNLDKLIADIQQDVAVAESDLKKAAAWIAANGPTYVQDAETIVSTLSALTGNLKISSSVISSLDIAIGDMQQFVGAVSSASSAKSTASAFDVLAAYGGSETPAVITAGYKVHQSLVAATAAARVALATASKAK